MAGRYSCNGIANVQEDSSIKVTELPVRLWTDTFRDNLETMRDPKEGKKPEINILVSACLHHQWQCHESNTFFIGLQQQLHRLCHRIHCPN